MSVNQARPRCVLEVESAGLSVSVNKAVPTVCPTGKAVQLPAAESSSLAHLFKSQPPPHTLLYAQHSCTLAILRSFTRHLKLAQHTPSQLCILQSHTLELTLVRTHSDILHTPVTNFCVLSRTPALSHTPLPGQAGMKESGILCLRA